jgi:CRISPR-associated protein Cas1
MHLILNSYGATLQKENDLFVVSSSEGSQSFPPDKVKSISISKAARITSDAVLLAIRHEVDILFVNDQGMPQGRVWSVQYGSISDIRRSQLDFLYSPAVIPWVKNLLTEKLNNQVALLLSLQPEDLNELPAYNLIRFAINSIEDHKGKISRYEGESLSDIAPSLRGWEGAAGRKYFSTISALMPEAYRFENRNRQPATDMFNSMLNYSYGILYGKVEGALIKAGIDPYAGIFHRDEYNRPALVYDVIERYRMWMDYVVVQLCRQQAIPPDCFETDKENGACKLEALGKRILIQAANDYLAEIIDIDGTERSRMTHIELQQQQLAQFFLKNKPS